MKLIQHNILIPLALALVFFISNVGLPIALVVCPEMESQSIEQTCCEHHSDQHGVKLSSPNTYGCCEKTVVAKPLKFESTELKATVGTLHKIKIELGSWVENAISTSSRPIVSVGASAGGVLLRSRDSYLLTSSLRI